MADSPSMMGLFINRIPLLWARLLCHPLPPPPRGTEVVNDLGARGIQNIWASGAATLLFRVSSFLETIIPTRSLEEQVLESDTETLAP